MKRSFWKAAALLLTLKLVLQPCICAVLAETAFDDVPAESQWYESVQYIAERGITIGTGNGTYSPDRPVTARQWAVMLRRAFGEEVETLEDPDVGHCRKLLYESVFSILGIHVDDDRSFMKTAAEMGLCHEFDYPSELVTRGECAFILYRMLTGLFCAENQVTIRESFIENPSGADTSDFLTELKRVPAPILRKFQNAGWSYAVDVSYLETLSKAYGMTCIGATDFNTNHIYVSEASATLHEFGHFLDGELGFPSAAGELYEREASHTEPFLRDYARRNHYEYFAEYFVYWLENCDDLASIAQMAELTPQTYSFFCELSENEWVLEEIDIDGRPYTPAF